MNEVNRTLFIPLYGKARVSQKGILLSDPTAEEIWEAEAFPIRGKSKSKWLAYNMAMRARVFDDWTDRMLAVLNEAPGESPQVLLERMRERVLTFSQGTIQFDDITMLCIELS